MRENSEFKFPKAVWHAEGNSCSLWVRKHLDIFNISSNPVWNYRYRLTSLNLTIVNYPLKHVVNLLAYKTHF